jgi:hypothetical protein
MIVDRTLTAWLVLRVEFVEVLTSAKGGGLFYEMGPLAPTDRVKIRICRSTAKPLYHQARAHSTRDGIILQLHSRDRILGG